MNSQRVLGVLEENGFDGATAETIVKMADAKPVQEAQELLAGMLGEQNPHVESYISNRRHAELAKQKAMSSHITVNKAKPKHSKPQPAAAKYSSSDKVDSVKDLEAAVQKLSVSAPDRKQCDCMGSRHGLLDMAPNCLNCGRIVCNKEGLGPCMFCKEPLLPTDKIRKIVDILNEQKSAVIATMSKKALAAAGIDPSIKQDAGSMFASSAEAEANLERLLGYQDNDSVRTRIIDQVGEVDLPNQGLNQWATPLEQAEQLRQQQRRLRKLELERKSRTGQGRKVLSIDVKGNKIYQTIEDAPLEDEDEDEDDEVEDNPRTEHANGGTNDDAHADPSSKLDSDQKTSSFYDPKPFNRYRVPRYQPSDFDSRMQPGDTRPMEAIEIRRDANEDLLY